MSEKPKEDNENDPKKTFEKRAEERKARFKKELEESTVSRSHLVLREFEIHNVSLVRFTKFCCVVVRTDHNNVMLISFALDWSLVDAPQLLWL